MGNIYFIAGVNGVGKTTLINHIHSRNPDFQIFKGSSMLMQYLGIESGDYAALQALPDEIKEQSVDEMMELVLSERPKLLPTLIIDAHLINYKRGEMRDATGPWMKYVDGVIVVSASAADILSRAEADENTGKRYRDLLPTDGLGDDAKVEWINKYLVATMLKAQEISKLYNLKLFEIINKQDNLEQSINRFEVIHKLCSEGEDYLPKLK